MEGEALVQKCSHSVIILGEMKYQPGFPVMEQLLALGLIFLLLKITQWQSNLQFYFVNIPFIVLLLLMTWSSQNAFPQNLIKGEIQISGHLISSR